MRDNFVSKVDDPIRCLTSAIPTLVSMASPTKRISSSLYGSKALAQSNELQTRPTEASDSHFELLKYMRWGDLSRFAKEHNCLRSM
jgi:hypothetical protein